MARTWKEARPLREWILVKADPRMKKTSGGIHLPDGQVMAERVMEGTGRVLKIGNREDVYKACSIALEPGMRIVFRGFLKDIWSSYFEREDDCDIFLLNSKDILALVDDDVRLGFAS